MGVQNKTLLKNLRIKGSLTATLRRSNVVIPAILVESTFLSRSQTVSLNAAGGLKIKPKGINKLKSGVITSANFRIELPTDLLNKVGWTAGDSIEFQIAGQNRINI